MRWRLVRRGYDEEEIDKTLDLLQESGLIEDRSLAEGLVRDAIERRLLGRKGIEAFLRHRGIDRDLIDEVLSHHSDDIELETAKRLIEKRLRTLQGQSREVMKRRLRGMLTRRGIAGDVIERALSEAGL
jgi:regulatory protein